MVKPVAAQPERRSSNRPWAKRSAENDQPAPKPVLKKAAVGGGADDEWDEF